MDYHITNNNGLSDDDIREVLLDSISNLNLKRVLIIPPDITRFHSKAGYITNQYYHILSGYSEVDILPALGTHFEMTEDEYQLMFGDIPLHKFIYHDWKNDVIEIGKVPKEYVSEITNQIWENEVTIEVNERLIKEEYDLIISIGQVVPHEVIGMANYTKNILVGCGGKNTINQSHMIGAVYGMENLIGKDHSPVRKILDYGQNHFLKDLPLLYVLTVTSAVKDDVTTHGLFIGDTRKTFERAVTLSQQTNIDFVNKPIKKCIVYLDPKEFKSTWLGNKAIYRTRMAIEDGGELIILASGIHQFGEDSKIDELIRKYGYVGRNKVLNLFEKNEELQLNMSAAAHLIHGSSDDRFTITYAVKNVSEEEIKQVNYNYGSYDIYAERYQLDTLKAGWNLVDGEEIYFIPNPALGLWINEEKFNKQ